MSARNTACSTVTSTTNGRASLGISVASGLHFASPVRAFLTISSVKSILDGSESATAHRSTSLHSITPRVLLLMCREPWTVSPLACSVGQGVLLSAVVLEVTFRLVIERLIIIFSHHYLKFRHNFFFLDALSMVTNFRQFAVREESSDLLLLEYFINKMAVDHQALQLFEEGCVVCTLVIRAKC